MGHHYFYVYYNREQYYHDLHGLSYRGESLKQKFIKLTCETHLRKMHRKIMATLGLDRESHKIPIVYYAPQLLVNTQFIVSNLYVTVKAIRFHTSASSQHASMVEEPPSSSLDMYPSVADAMPFPYNTQPCNAVDDLDNTEEAKVLGTT
nr:hypothetical protein CFP56_14143 [Quercus suber]